MGCTTTKTNGFEFEDTSHANEAVAQPATSASRMKIFLENMDLRGSLAGPLACST